MSSVVEIAQARRDDGRIGEALVRLNRVVQRATIYPVGHPAIPNAVRSFVESLEAVLAVRETLLVGVTSDQLFVEGVGLEDRRAALAWLTEQLNGRGIASFELARGVAEPQLIQFVEWLAQPPVEAEGGEPPRLPGIVLTRFDYTKARFADAPADKLNDPAHVWQALAANLGAGWYVDDRPLPDDPVALAAELASHVLRNEGIGAAPLLARIEAAGAYLPHLPAEVRAALKERLGAFVGALAPELRSQLLRLDKDASRQRVEFLAEMADSLPEQVVMEMLADIDQGSGALSLQTLNLLNKLIGVAAKDALSKEMAETKLQSLGLPPGLTELKPDEVTSVLAQVFEGQGEFKNPSLYQERLQDLSAGSTVGSAHYESSHFSDPRDPGEVRAHLSAIVLRLLSAGPELPEAAGYMRRLLTHVPGEVESERFDILHEIATVAKELAAPGSPAADDLRPLTSEYLVRLASPETVAALLRGAERGPESPGKGLVGLFRKAGTDAACAAFDRLAEMPEDAGRERLMRLVFALGPDDLAAAVARLRSAGSPSLRALFLLLRHPESPFGTEHVLGLLGNRDASIRLEAYRLVLEGDPAAIQFRRLLAKALGDSDEGVVRLALERSQGVGAGATKPLAEFVAGWLSRRSRSDLGKLAIAALATGGKDGRDALIRLLRDRRLALAMRAVRQSMALEAGLLRVADEESIAAVRSFRRSPAGWLSMLLSEES